MAVENLPGATLQEKSETRFTRACQAFQNRQGSPTLYVISGKNSRIRCNIYEQLNDLMQVFVYLKCSELVVIVLVKLNGYRLYGF